MIMFQAMGVSLLFVMGLFPSIWTVGWLILPVYILRTVCNNCCYAIIRSLLMDYVPKVLTGFCIEGFGTDWPLMITEGRNVVRLGHALECVTSQRHW